MNGRQPPAKSVVTVSEMADLCQISRSRFYDLMEAGVFPKPVQHPSSKRPMFDIEAQRKCLEIRQTGIGANGLPVLFNRKPTNPRQSKKLRKIEPAPQHERTDLLDALKGLGLNTTAQAVTEALTQLFPDGHADLNQGDVIRKVFLHLQGRKN